MTESGLLARRGGNAIAYRRTPGRAPGVVFLHGFRSDMTGDKATAVEGLCRARGNACVLFDGFGHGKSTGDFAQGTIGRWAEDAAAVLDELTQGPQILVGSSMGGWLMLLAALARPARIAGLLGIAAAPDFTEDLILPSFDAAARARLEAEGQVLVPSGYGLPPYPITKRLIEDGRKHLLLRAPIPIRCPVRLLHGTKDPDVPWQTSQRLAERLDSADVSVTLIKDGGHRLNDPGQIAQILAALGALLGAISA